MKEFRLSRIVFFFVPLLPLTSCSKKEDPKSRTELLTVMNWTMTKVEVMVGGSYQDASSYLIEDCSKDDIITFSKSYAYKFDTGADDCKGNNLSKNGTWAFKDGEKTLSVKIDSTTEDSQIES